MIDLVGRLMKRDTRRNHFSMRVRQHALSSLNKIENVWVFFDMFVTGAAEENDYDQVSVR